MWPSSIAVDPVPEREVGGSSGVRVAVHLLAGAGRPAVLVHAAGFHGLVWQPAASQLADVFRCVAPDLRGHGDSGVPPQRDFDWRGFAADVLAVVEGLGLERPVALGHSSGATALLLAEQARPGTFVGLYCYEPVVVPAVPPLGRDPDNWLAQACRRRRDAFTSASEALDHYRQKSPLSDVDPEVLGLYVGHGLEGASDGGQRLKCRPEDEARIYEMAAAHDCFARLPEVNCPVTVAYGGRSEAFTLAHAEKLAAAIPSARVEQAPTLGHLGPLENPRGVARSARLALPTM